jgi:hypothetical protein
MTLCVYLRGSSYWRSLRPLRLADEGTLLSKSIGIVELLYERAGYVVVVDAVLKGV